MQITRGFRVSLVSVVVLVLGAVASCSPAIKEESPQKSPKIEAALTDLKLADASGRELVDALDRLPVAQRPSELMASVRVHEVVLSDSSKNELMLALPDDEFYVSFAPYIESTHPCTFHSLTTCLGEMRNADISVKVTDTESGKVLLNDKVTTFDNGFYGLWLPRDGEFALEVSDEGKSGKSGRFAISTDADSATCVTDLKLT